MTRRLPELVRDAAPAALALALGLSGMALAASFPVASGSLTAITVPGGVPAQTCTLTAAAADAYADESTPDGTSGPATMLEVRSGPSDRRTFVRFDLAGCSIPQGAWVSSATLKLHLSSAPSESRSYDAHRITTAWDEAAITWNNQAAVAASATSSASTGTTTGTNVDWPVTADIRSFLDGTTTNHGWRIRDADEMAPVSVGSAFSSREHATAGQRPVLTIAYHP
jgi:hypothetical protein